MSEEKKRRFIRRSKEKQKKLPVVRKKYSMKFFKIGFIVMIVFICASGVLAFMKANLTAQKVRRVDSHVTQLNTNVKSIKNRDISYTPALENFAKKVVDLYINVPKDETALKQRNESLQALYGRGLKVDVVNNPNVERKLVSSTFLNLQRIDGVNTAKFKVIYSVSETKKVDQKVKEKYKEGETEKEREVIKQVDQTTTNEVTNVLCIPYAGKDNMLSVVAMPYLDKYSESKSNVSSIQNNLKKDVALSGSKNEQINKFLKVFLKKYATATNADMQFLMNEPESLGGTVQFKDMESQNFKKDKQFISKVDVNFVEKGTDYPRHEQMTFYIVQKDNAFFVNKLVHNQGGN